MGAKSLRASAFHEAGHVATGIAIGLGMPDALELDRRRGSLARIAWNYNPLHGGTPRELLAVHLLAGYVSECRARGWRRVDAVTFCERRSAWIDGRPVADRIRPAWWSKHADIDHLAVLYSSERKPRPLRPDILRRLWDQTLGVIESPRVWEPLVDLANRALKHGRLDRGRLYDWQERFPQLENALLTERAPRR